VQLPEQKLYDAGQVADLILLQAKVGQEVDLQQSKIVLQRLRLC
jgi:hypothetical protein